jgi:hypothetical protein
MTFYWWEDAIAHANDLARWTQIRHKVAAGPGGWIVDLADDAVLLERASA